MLNLEFYVIDNFMLTFKFQAKSNSSNMWIIKILKYITGRSSSEDSLSEPWKLI